MCDTCGQATQHGAQCKGTFYSYQYVPPPSASEEAPPPAPTASAETLREAPAASGGSAAARLSADLEAEHGPDCIWLNPPPPPLRWSCPAGWECEAHDQDAAFAAHRNACGRGCSLEELEIICPLAAEEPDVAVAHQHTMDEVAALLGVSMQVDSAAEMPTAAPAAANADLSAPLPPIQILLPPGTCTTTSSTFPDSDSDEAWVRYYASQPF